MHHVCLFVRNSHESDDPASHGAKFEMPRKFVKIKTLFLLLLLTACTENVSVAEWKGRWTGPEGTYLEIADAQAGYEIVISSLDGPRTFEGKAEDGAIIFTRDGKQESITAGTGSDTGMKWLAEKKNCLVIAKGEGYCRD